MEIREANALKREEIGARLAEDFQSAFSIRPEIVWVGPGELPGVANKMKKILKVL
jgi:phenylacetate-coenzyme A ligase PaaK-like adenylate-forming protein